LIVCHTVSSSHLVPSGARSEGPQNGTKRKAIGVPHENRKRSLKQVFDVLYRQIFYSRMIDVHLKDIHAASRDGVRTCVGSGRRREEMA
jgi:hypothetical protein